MPVHEREHALEHGDIITTGERWGIVWTTAVHWQGG